MFSAAINIYNDTLAVKQLFLCSPWPKKETIQAFMYYSITCNELKKNLYLVKNMLSNDVFNNKKKEVEENTATKL